MAFGLIVIALLLLVAYLPGAWVQRVIAEHSAPRPDMPGTGGQFARHVLDGMGLAHVKVEPTKLGDHYDPSEKVVRLATERFEGRSLAAIVIAAHEVGHAMQDATGYAPLARRTATAKTAAGIERIGSIVMLISPVLLIVMKSPVALVLDYLAGAVILASAALMHVFTLPVEFDASFKRALPLLEQGRFLKPADMPAARTLLRAAAFTYVAGAMMTLLNIGRWFRVFRF
jgi:uncharacterized protein